MIYSNSNLYFSKNYIIIKNILLFVKNNLILQNNINGKRANIWFLCLQIDYKFYIKAKFSDCTA